MKTIPADTVFFIKRVGNGIHVRPGRHCLVKCRIEHGYLRHTGQQMLHGGNSFQVGRIVQGRKRNAGFEVFNGLFGDQAAFLETFAAMHHPVPDGVDLG